MPEQARPRKIRLGKTAWGVLHALAQNNGRGHVNWGRRYPELSPGRAVVFSQSYHGLFAQQLLTRRGCNHPGDAVLTDRGIAAYLTGSIDAVRMTGSYLDEKAGEPFTATGQGIPLPGDHRWAQAARTPLSRRPFR